MERKKEGKKEGGKEREGVRALWKQMKDFVTRWIDGTSWQLQAALSLHANNQEHFI